MAETDISRPQDRAPSQAAISEPRIGVYICHCGGNISDVVDVRKVADEAAGLRGVVVSTTNLFMCSDPGQGLIIDDIKKHGLNRVVVASCSPSLHELTFRGALARAGINPYLYEHCNIREHVSWTHHNKAEATVKAVSLVKASVAKACLLESLEPIKVGATAHAVVIGAGVSGLSAALELSKAGILVTLVEKSSLLGGKAARLDSLYPDGAKAGELVAGLSEQVIKDSRITIHTCAEVTASEGYVGNFTLTVNQRACGTTLRSGEKSSSSGFQGSLLSLEGYSLGEESSGSRDNQADEKTFAINCGAIVVATGFETYTPFKREYGYQKFPEVVTLPDFIKTVSRLDQSETELKIDGQGINSVAFIHCVGSRQVEGINKPQPDGKVNDYCSKVCCTSVLRTANELCERFPGIQVYDFYQDIRTYGRYQEEYYENASKAGVLFFRWLPESPPEVAKGSGNDSDALTVKVKDGLTWGQELEAGVDLVVLAVGMMPSDITGVVEAFKLPQGADRFLQEVHPKLQPVEVADRGIVLAGTCQGPKDVNESCSAAKAAAAKVVSLLSRDKIELDPFVANVNHDRFDIEGKKETRAVINPAICVGCGCCVAVCPERAIDINGWTLDQYEAMVDAFVGSVPEGE